VAQILCHRNEADGKIVLDRFFDARAVAPPDAFESGHERSRRPHCAVFENDPPVKGDEPADRSTERLLEWQKLRCYKGE
jgi:hypothetical protein